MPDANYVVVMTPSSGSVPFVPIGTKTVNGFSINIPGPNDVEINLVVIR
jgi:hypothetical protein